jgi:hypothetical protein
MVEFKKGDVVTLRGKVSYIHGDGEVSLDIFSCYSSILIRPEMLTLVHHEFNVGDRVSDVGGIGTVRAVHGVCAWIETDDGSLWTGDLSDMEHVPPTTEDEENVL